MLAYVVGGEWAQRVDALMLASEVVEHASHQPVGHALASKGRAGFDVGDNNGLTVSAVIGDRHDFVVDHEFVASSGRVVLYDVVHRSIVARICGLSATLRP